jgi:hypothetical protein
MKKRISIFHDNLILETARELAQERGIKFRSAPENFVNTSEWGPVEAAIATDEMYATFLIQQMPGCCAVLTLSYIRPNPRTQETVDYVIQFVEEAAEAAGFGSVVMTQVVPAFTKYMWKHEPWIKCLDRKWKVSDPFRNAKSGNLCIYLTKDLKQPNKRQGLERVVEE